MRGGGDGAVLGGRGGRAEGQCSWAREDVMKAAVVRGASSGVNSWRRLGEGGFRFVLGFGIRRIGAGLLACY